MHPAGAHTGFRITPSHARHSDDANKRCARYYDAFLYLAGWGTRDLLLRFPARRLGLDTARRYCSGDTVSAWRGGEHVLVAAVSDEEQEDFDCGGEGVLATELPVRSEVLAGDERPLYLLWLLGPQSGDVDDEVFELPVPAGLDALSGAQAALVEFLRIDGELVSVTAAGSPSEQDDTPPRHGSRGSLLTSGIGC